MKKVILATQWFGPGGVRYRPGEHEMDDATIEHLPSSAKVVEEKKGEAPKPPAK